MEQIAVNRELMKKWNDKRKFNEQKGIAKFWQLKETFKNMKLNSEIK